jgi:hypothetical protein
VLAAYAIQDAFVAPGGETGLLAGYKIALSPRDGASSALTRPGRDHLPPRSGAPGRFAPRTILIVEFEIGVEIGEDLPVADAPFTRERVPQAIGASCWRSRSLTTSAPTTAAFPPPVRVDRGQQLNEGMVREPRSGNH